MDTKTLKSGLLHALPFWVSLMVVPVAIFAATRGGIAVLSLIPATFVLFGVLDKFIGENRDNLDPQTPTNRLFWHRLITILWAPIQLCLIFGSLAWISWSDQLGGWESLGLMIGVGVSSGVIGIVYAHELMHRSSRFERWLGDLLMAMVLYGHFRSEHLLVHHRYVGTPRDAVTARFNEGFHRFFIRVLPESLNSAWRAEKAKLARKRLPWWDRANPFWRYWALQGLMLLLALAIGGWGGLLLFLVQAYVAVWLLELIDYIEHYALVRKHLGGGKYEHVHPHHSWNASQRASNWLLINLQRHSDHHFKPDRRFPLLQTYGPSQAPQLPYGYPVMGLIAVIPPLWRRIMNPRVRRWREMFYPEITDWRPYNKARTPMPR